MAPLTLEDFKAHADKFGDELVVETAKDFLSKEELLELIDYVGGSRFVGKTASRSHNRDIASEGRTHKRGRPSRISKINDTWVERSVNDPQCTICEIS